MLAPPPPPLPPHPQDLPFDRNSFKNKGIRKGMCNGGGGRRQRGFASVLNKN